MILTFIKQLEPEFSVAGHNGRGTLAKVRVGQQNNVVSKMYRIQLPDKINNNWYEQATKALKGCDLSRLKHTIKVDDTSTNLVKGYQALKAEQGINFCNLSINPLNPTFITQLGRAILLLKGQAAKKQIGY